MKKVKMKAWVKALRSGKFKQATGHLRATDDETGALVGHCCLGVLGKVCKIPDYKITGTELLSDYGLREKCGLRTDDGQPVDSEGNPIEQAIEFTIKGKKKFFDSLAVANDDGISFKRIARWVEKNYKRL